MRVVEAVESLAKSWDPLLLDHATRITRKISKRRAAGCVSLGSIHTSSLSQAGPGLPSHLSQWVSYGQNIGAPALHDGQKQSNLRRDFPLLLPLGKAPLPAAGVGAASPTYVQASIQRKGTRGLEKHFSQAHSPLHNLPSEFLSSSWFPEIWWDS